jgi:hypothetical protein
MTQPQVALFGKNVKHNTYHVQSKTHHSPLKTLSKLPATLVVVLLLLLAGCRDGKIPCPDLGGKKKLSLFKKKSAPTQAKEMPLGQNVAFGKNGLIKKKKYKYLRNKPNRKKYK